MKEKDLSGLDEFVEGDEGLLDDEREIERRRVLQGEHESVETRSAREQHVHLLEQPAAFAVRLSARECVRCRVRTRAQRAEQHSDRGGDMRTCSSGTQTLLPDAHRSQQVASEGGNQGDCEQWKGLRLRGRGLGPAGRPPTRTRTRSSIRTEQLAPVRPVCRTECAAVADQNAAVDADPVELQRVQAAEERLRHRWSGRGVETAVAAVVGARSTESARSSESGESSGRSRPEGLSHSLADLRGRSARRERGELEVPVPAEVGAGGVRVQQEHRLAEEDAESAVETEAARRSGLVSAGAAPAAVNHYQSRVQLPDDRGERCGVDWQRGD